MRAMIKGCCDEHKIDPNKVSDCEKCNKIGFDIARQQRCITIPIPEETLIKTLREEW